MTIYLNAADMLCRLLVTLTQKCTCIVQLINKVLYWLMYHNNSLISGYVCVVCVLHVHCAAMSSLLAGVSGT